MVRTVSEDELCNMIEFNEFLKMMSKQKEEDIKEESLVEAFTKVCKIHLKKNFIHMLGFLIKTEMAS